MKLDEPIKIQLCQVLKHLFHYQLQDRIESLIPFSEQFVAPIKICNLKFTFLG